MRVPQVVQPDVGQGVVAELEACPGEPVLKARLNRSGWRISPSIVPSTGASSRASVRLIVASSARCARSVASVCGSTSITRALPDSCPGDLSSAAELRITHLTDCPIGRCAH